MLLDSTICENFRKIINSSPIFCEDKELEQNWSLICVVMDRVDNCVKSINEREEDFYKSEEDFMIFFMFAAMLKDAIRELFKKLNIDYPYDKDQPDSYKYFCKVFTAYECVHTSLLKNDDEKSCSRRDCLSPKCPKYNDNKLENCPRDDQFFKYLRALVFAHPCETSQHKFLKNEIQYSPWVIAGETSLVYSGKIGIRIYSSRFRNIFDFYFSPDILKMYMLSRFNLINIAIDWAKNKIKEYETEWSKRKVNRDLEPIDILKDIIQILIERYGNDLTSEIDEAIIYLSQPLTEEKNRSAVEKYRQHLVETIPGLCDSIDNVNREEYLTDSFMNALSPRLIFQYTHCSYQLQKIFNYLKNNKQSENDSFNTKLGLEQLRQFYDSLAKDYVVIRHNMPFNEIRLLVTTTLYLEQENQKIGEISPSLKKTILENEAQEDKIIKPSIIETIGIETDDEKKIVLNIVDASRKNKE